MTNKKTITFGDICREVKLSTKDPVTDGFERYVGLEHLDPGSIKIKRWGMISEDNPSFTRVFKKGHILFGKRRPYLRKAAVAEFNGICSSDIIVMEPKENETLKPLVPFLIHSEPFWQWAVKNSSGSLSPRTNFSALSKFEIPTLEKVEIESMVATLQSTLAVEHKIDSTQEALSKVIDQLIADTVSKSEFRKVSLQELGVTITAGKSPSALDSPPSSEQFGVLKVSAITSSNFEPTESKTLKQTPDYPDELLVKNGDLLISRANGNPNLVGVCCLVKDNKNENLYLSDKTLRLDISSGYKSFIKTFLNSEKGRHQIVPLMSGSSGQKNISQSKILSISIPRLSEAQLQKYETTLNHIEDLKVSLSSKKENIRSLMYGITNRIFGA